MRAEADAIKYELWRKKRLLNFIGISNAVIRANFDQKLVYGYYANFAESGSKMN